jgi:succinate dehydrogenase / fumarate reductase flavoprotein subunit
MHHQFKELADVDITAEPMEVGPTCHYVMGGIEVDPDTAAAAVPGLFAVGECSGGMHGSNRLGGNSLSDLLVFGRRAGLGAAAYIEQLTERPAVADADIDAAAKTALAPFDPPAEGTAENPYTLHSDMQQTMNDLVGIIRKDHELTQAIEKLGELRERFDHVTVQGNRPFNPGWHLALDLRNMLLVSECVAHAAQLRTESRGGHTRDDHPKMDADWRKALLVCRVDPDGVGQTVPAVTVTREPQKPMRDELLALFDLGELEKYYTPAELADHPATAESSSVKGDA